MKRTRAVLVAPKQFDFVQEEIPKLKENEVLYKTISVGLCHSDIPAYRGTSAMGFGNKHGYDAMIKNPQFPMGIGHEPVCVVEDVGSAPHGKRQDGRSARGKRWIRRTRIPLRCP